MTASAPELVWDDFVDRLARWVRRTFYWSDPDALDDAVQEACLVGWELWCQWQQRGWPENPLAYAQRSVRRHLVRWWGKERRQREGVLPLEQADGALSGAVGADPALKIEMEALLGRLSVREREIIERRVIREEPFAAIARDLGCTDSHARVLYQRARRKLQQWWME